MGAVTTGPKACPSRLLPLRGCRRSGIPAWCAPMQASVTWVRSGRCAWRSPRGRCSTAAAGSAALVSRPSPGPTGTIERGTARSQPQALGRGGGKETVAFRAPLVLAPRPGASPRVIITRLGLHPGGDETRRRCVLNTPGPELAWPVHQATPREEPRCDGAAHGDQAGRWRMRQPPVASGAHPPFVPPPGAQTKRIHDCPPGRSVPRWRRSA